MNKILVAYNGGEPGRRALALAAKLAGAFGSQVDVVSVVPEGFGSVEGAVEEPAIVHARELVEARALLRDHGVDAGLIEPAGDPARTIERLVAEGAYDAVIVGGSQGLADGRPRPDTVMAHIAAHATATVIVAH